MLTLIHSAMNSSSLISRSVDGFRAFAARLARRHVAHPLPLRAVSVRGLFGLPLALKRLAAVGMVEEVVRPRLTELLTA